MVALGTVTPLWVGDPLAESQERRQSISEVEDFFLAVVDSVLLLSSSGLAVLHCTWDNLMTALIRVTM